MIRVRISAWSWFRCRCVGLFAAVVVLVVACGDDANPLEGEIPGNDVLVRGELSVDEFAEVVEIVGDGHLPVETRLAVAEALPRYLEEIGTAAMSEADDDFGRPEIVALAAELGRDEEVALVMADAVAEWSIERAEVFVTQPEFDRGDVEGAVLPVAMVTAATMDGLRAVDHEDFNMLNHVVDSTSDALIEPIIDDRGGQRGIPDHIPASADPDATEVDFHSIGWIELKEKVLVNASPNFDDNPIGRLESLILEQASERRYQDPETDNWDAEG